MDVCEVGRGLVHIDLDGADLGVESFQLVVQGRGEVVDNIFTSEVLIGLFGHSELKVDSLRGGRARLGKGEDALHHLLASQASLSDLLLEVLDPHVVIDEHVRSRGDADQAAEGGGPEPALARGGLLLLLTRLRRDSV